MEEGRQLLNLIPNKREWMVRDAEEKKLELRLGPPREEDWQEAVVEEKHEESSVLSLGYHPKSSKTSKRVFLDTVQSNPEGFLQLKATGGCGKDSSSQKGSGWSEQQQNLERKACCPSSSSHAAVAASGNANGAIANTSQTRATTAVRAVGWPPVRSFRKNLASSSAAKPPPAPQNGSLQTEVKPDQNCKKGLFVKINMDGIPIGRKVDLKAYESYEKLSSAVDELFRGLLAAQRDPSSSKSMAEEKQVFTGLLDGSGEYTLVYEDHEGDRMLVGDVPWEMFVSTAKRLRVLKSSELSGLSLGAASRKRTATGC